MTMKILKRNLKSNKIIKFFCLMSVCFLTSILLKSMVTQVVITTLETLTDIKTAFDTSPLIQDIQNHVPSLPIEFWKRIKNKSKNMKFNSTCGKFPDFFNIHYSNAYWQTLETTNGTFQFFGAYLDVRNSNIKKPTIRILGMINRIQPTVKTHCQIWFENNSKPIITPILDYKYIWIPQWGNYKQGIYQPYLMTCKIPKEYWNGIQPVAVSIVEEPCDQSVTLLTVFYNKPEEEKKDFAVCVKGLNFPYEDFSLRIIEWVELLNILGVDKIYFYELSVHPNIKRVLDYYEKEEKIHVTPLTLAGTQPSEPLIQYYYLQNKIGSKRQNELIPYNDCFYKHMYEYRYIVLLDIDEVIMPKKRNTWRELVDDALEKFKRQQKAKKIERSYLSVRNVYFFDDAHASDEHRQYDDDVPKYMHMLRHVYRSKNYTKPGHYVKSFFNTEKVLTVHNHWPLACLGNCYQYPIETEDAQLQHYRKDCVAELKNACKLYKENNMLDNTIRKFKQPLVDQVRETLATLGYLKGDT